VAALVILSRFRWWLPLVLAAGHAVSLHWRRRHWLAITQVVFDRTDSLRQADYLRRLAVQPHAAKESQVFSLSGWLVDRYRDSFLTTMQPVWRERRSGLSSATGVALLMLALDVAGLVFVARAGVQGTIGLGAAVVYAQAVLGAAALSAFDLNHVRLEDGLASLRVLRGLQAAVPAAVQNLSGARPAAGLPERVIRFEGVRFRYPGRDENVFDGLDLDIVAGQSLAIVGTNGAGKTTLVKLLARLYDVDGGRITVDGIDLRDLDPAEWQRRVAAIFQDFVQYPVSAHDNVAFGAVSRHPARGAARAQAGNRSAVEQAGHRAGAGDFVTALPKGWDTVLSRQFTDGADLSGGEWQRIALARALYAVAAGAGVLVLDEPTASLDVRAEAGLYERFLDLTRGVTTIVVSHRFSTVRRAQRIVVLEHGRVVEDGSHDDLVRAGGRYASMYALQASRFWVESEEDG
jgi:ATP-binding cassette, subfamily B, bacterial